MRAIPLCLSSADAPAAACKQTFFVLDTLEQALYERQGAAKALITEVRSTVVRQRQILSGGSRQVYNRLWMAG